MRDIRDKWRNPLVKASRDALTRSLGLLPPRRFMHVALPCLDHMPLSVDRSNDYPFIESMSAAG